LAQAFVLGVGPAPVRLPGLAPLLLEAALVLLEDLAVLPGRHELAERRFPEVVHEGVLGADEPVSGLAGAPRVVVVLEHADLEALVERADAAEDVPAEGEA